VQVSDDKPTQTSFIQRRLQKQREEERRREDAERKNEAEIRAAKERADDITLKESIAKVKSWKQQLQRPPDDDDAADSIFGKEDWRKRKPLHRGSSMDDAPTSPVKANKTFAGVPAFPPVNSLTDGTVSGAKSSRLSAAAATTSNRSVSPYDNLKPPARHTAAQQRTNAPRGTAFYFSLLLSFRQLYRPNVWAFSRWNFFISKFPFTILHEFRNKSFQREKFLKLTVIRTHSTFHMCASVCLYDCPLNCEKTA